MPARSPEARNLTEYISDTQTILPRKSSAKSAARKIARLHARFAGATFSLYFGDLTGQSLFAFSIFNRRSRSIPGRLIDEGILMGFIESNRSILSDPRTAAGTWFDEESGNSYLDVSITVTSKQLAIRLAGEYNQKGIFDLEKRKEMPTRGSGAVARRSETERLPPLKRGREPE
jgi:hypothetical protein